MPLLDRLLYHPLRKAVQVGVEDRADPGHALSVGSMLSMWAL